jgi:bifunctional enzyme CysN/CysC
MPLNLVIVGHVDHGKSTLIGRLLFETKSLPDGKYEELLASSQRRGVEIEWSFALDALQAERDQAITIDTTRIWFSAHGRRYAIIDAPGHRQFITNMLSGASEADAAILMVDVTEGVSEQTRRHAYLLQLLGIEQVVVAVNKMDLIVFEQQRFEEVARDCARYLAGLDISAAAVVPISARHGDNLTSHSERLSWYSGPTILDMLAAFAPVGVQLSTPFRMRVQDVYRRETTRIAVGRPDSGFLSVGDTVVISPTGSTARISSLERWPLPGPNVAHAGESIGFTIDQPVYIERGDVISHVETAPHRASAFGAKLFWLDETGPEPGQTFRLQFGPTEARVSIEMIERVVDTTTLKTLESSTVPQYAVVDCALRSSAVLPLDTRETSTIASRCVLLRGAHVVAGGFISRVSAPVSSRSTNIHPQSHLVSRAERAERNGHAGAVVWLTGLSGAGKSTIAMAAERRLFARGYFVYVLDGDNVRSGLNRDLGFSAEDRTENIRRIGEMAALFADAGAIVITAFISPFAKDRSIARQAAGSAFHEIYIKADLATCETRDPKGLYRRARTGEIADFTGISAPYEVPARPELVVDTSADSPDACVEQLVEYIGSAVSVKREPAGSGNAR